MPWICSCSASRKEKTSVASKDRHGPPHSGDHDDDGEPAAAIGHLRHEARRRAHRQEGAAQSGHQPPNTTAAYCTGRDIDPLDVERLGIFAGATQFKPIAGAEQEIPGGGNGEEGEIGQELLVEQDRSQEGNFGKQRQRHIAEERDRRRLTGIGESGPQPEDREAGAQEIERQAGDDLLDLQA